MEKSIRKNLLSEEPWLTMRVIQKAEREPSNEENSKGTNWLLLLIKVKEKYQMLRVDNL